MSLSHDLEKKLPVDTTSAILRDTDSDNGATQQTTIYIDPEKEKALYRKLDRYVLPASFVFMVLCALDRNNLGNARVFGFDEDLGLQGRQFGNINTFSSLATMLFEIPWVLAVRRFGANAALGSAFAIWSAATLGTAFIQNYAQAVICRMLVNAAGGGLEQGFAFLFSTMYPRHLAGRRIITNNLSMCVSGAFGGLFAWAIQQMGDKAGLAAWRWLFIIEFLITIVVGGICWCFLPKTAETAWFLNAEEKETMCLRKQRDIMFRGEDKMDRKWIRPALTEPFVYMLGIAFFTSSVSVNGFNIFLPTILLGMGYANLHVNYMTIPVYVVGAISLITVVFLSDRFKRRGAFIIGCCISPVIGYLIAVGTPNQHAGYAAMFILVLGIYPISTLAVTWAAGTLAPDDKRAIGMPLASSIGNLSNFVSSQLYPTQQGPRYRQGNGVSAGLVVVAAGLYGSIWFMLRRRNLQKEKLISEGATDNGKMGDQALGHVYIL
ncbi:putative transporter [Cyphellophora attinorum]|uniref:Putative transporter n=1 Tax=Cyphellophora attinorum TaxID=1664694 RepID=A0A0N1H050_9EURO|nr:putative transporter [Phialophora attinorum]KPI36955.1 putative transporter [Phialophora attinorum]